MKRIIKSNEGQLDRGYIALERSLKALRNAYDVLSQYEDNIEQILDDPSFYDDLMEEVQYLESAMRSYGGRF